MVVLFLPPLVGLDVCRSKTLSPIAHFVRLGPPYQSNHWMMIQAVWL